MRRPSRSCVTSASRPTPVGAADNMSGAEGEGSLVPLRTGRTSIIYRLSACPVVGQTPENVPAFPEPDIVQMRVLVSFLKTHPPRLSCSLSIDPLLARHGQMALDRPRDTAVRDAHAPGVATREPRASAATRRVEGARAAAAADGDG